MHPLKPFVAALKYTRYFGTVASNMIKLTGKYQTTIHPKHLIIFEKPWYMKYIKSGQNVLDIGCYKGNHVFRCAGICSSVVGMDYSYNAIKAAREIAKSRGIKNVQFICRDIENGLGMNEEKFDAVLFLDVIEHIDNRNGVLKDIKKVLKPGGIMLISAPNIDTSWKNLQKKVGLSPYADSDHKIEFTKKELFGLISKRFDILDWNVISYDTPLSGIIDLIGGISLSLYKRLVLWKIKMVKLRPNETSGFRVIAKVKK